tara:strand:- start:47401 stop:47946 length:546 start_codon:yes stop_codon:yes gene_type:complete
MALLPSTGIETHPSGTGGLNAVINGNWDALEAIFDEATTGSNPTAFQAPARAITRTDLTGLEVGDEMAVWNGSNWILRKGVDTLTATASVDLPMDHDDARLKILDISENTTLTTSDVKAGGSFEIIIRSDGTLRTLTFPGSWVWAGAAAPANIAASKSAVLQLRSTSTSDSGIIATWTVEA